MIKDFIGFVRRAFKYVVILFRYILTAGFIGVVCGWVGTAFHMGVDIATQIRELYPWLLFAMPLVGLLIVATYTKLHSMGQGTNDVFYSIVKGNKIELNLLPAVFIGTVLTHLVGGSSGREGAALQMGGSIGYYMGTGLGLSERRLRMAVMCGMAALFSALFGTPLTAAVFAVMIVSVGTIVHVTFIPCLAASIVAYYTSVSLGVPPTRYAIEVPDINLILILKVMALAAGCALVSAVFCRILHASDHIFSKIKNDWLRVVAGSAVIIALTLIVGNRDYNGTGMDVIQMAIEEGQAAPPAFLLKMIFTAVTLSCGFKGGEVVPSFFIGATFGCVVSPFLGIPAGFGAAVGLICVFCGVTNGMLTSIFLSAELFGSGGIMVFAVACGISYMLSGYTGLYSSQVILFDKLKPEWINVHTNHYHAGDKYEGKDSLNESLWF